MAVKRIRPKRPNRPHKKREKYTLGGMLLNKSLSPLCGWPVPSAQTFGQVFGRRRFDEPGMMIGGQHSRQEALRGKRLTSEALQRAEIREQCPTHSALADIG